MLPEVNGILGLVGDQPIEVPGPVTAASELDFPKRVKAEYARRLAEEVPNTSPWTRTPFPKCFSRR